MELAEVEGHDRPVLVITEDDVSRFEDKNWLRVPEQRREDCVGRLASWLGDMPKDDLREAISEPGFHMFGGMAVRNELREVMSDRELPPVKYPNGGFYSNWDDYYMAALRDYLER